MNKPITNARVTRWLSLLQEFYITIVDKPGKENVVADFLSRLTHNDDDSPVEDSFHNVHLFFAVSTYSPWYADITNYLDTCRLPTHLSKRDKKEGSYNRVQGIVGSEAISSTQGLIWKSDVM